MSVTSINPSNLHEFTREIVEFYGTGENDIVAELKAVQATISNFSEYSSDPLDALAATIDDVILDMLIKQYESILAAKDEPTEEVKEVKKHGRHKPA